MQEFSGQDNLQDARPTGIDVSVIIPNYNYGRYLEKRIESILKQKFSRFELIILDDASTDDSRIIIEKYASLPFVRVYYNEENGGNVFLQWAKGLQHAKGELVWIAEADDLAEPEFLETLVPFFDDPEVVLASCASLVIDENGNPTGMDYRYYPYLQLLSTDRWHKDYKVSGHEEIRRGMGSRNTILNVSSALFRKPSLKILEESLQYELSGDWIFYLNMLEKGKIAYTAKALNWHRRHMESVAGKVDNNAHILLNEFYRVHSRNIRRFPFGEEIMRQIPEFFRLVISRHCQNLTEEEIRKAYPLIRERA